MTTKRKIWIGALGLLLILIVQSQIKSCIRENDEEKEIEKLALKEAFIPNKKNYEVEVNQLQINGPLGEYIKIVGSKAEFNFINTSKDFMDKDHFQKWELKLKCVRLSKKLEWDIETLNGNYTNLSLFFLDEKGNPISGGEVNGASGHDVIDKILSLKNGEEGWVTFNLTEGKVDEQDVLINWKKFTVNSEVGFVTESSSDGITESSSDEITESSSTSSKDCEKFINDYEKFVSSYIAILKKYKANPNDMSILTEYSEMASKAVTMKKDASSCTDAKYVVKLMKLNTKIANAAAGM